VLLLRVRFTVAVAEEGRGGDVRYHGEIDTAEAATRMPLPPCPQCLEAPERLALTPLWPAWHAEPQVFES
jgi:hypothetical protein